MTKNSAHLCLKSTLHQLYTFCQDTSNRFYWPFQAHLCLCLWVRGPCQLLNPLTWISVSASVEFIFNFSDYKIDTWLSLGCSQIWDTTARGFPVLTQLSTQFNRLNFVFLFCNFSIKIYCLECKPLIILSIMMEGQVVDFAVSHLHKVFL